jgi:hypothetical protein
MKIDRFSQTSLQIFERCSSIKFHENLSSGSRVVPCRRRDMKKPLVTYRNFATAHIYPYILPNEYIFMKSYIEEPYSNPPKVTILGNSRLSPPCKLRSLLFCYATQRRLVVTDISGLSIGSIFNGRTFFLNFLVLENWTVMLFRNVSSYKSMLRNTPEERSSHNNFD